MTKIEFPRKPVAFLVYFLKSLSIWQKLALLATFLMAVSTTGASYALLYAFKILLDSLPNATADDVWGTLLYPFILIVVFCILHNLSFRIRDFIGAYSVPSIQNSLRNLLVRNLLCHSHDYFHNRFSGELVNKVGNVSDGFSNIVWQRLINGFVPAGAAVISSVIILCSIDSNLALILIAATVGLILSVVFLGHYISRASGKVADCEGGISGQLVDTLTNISSVKSFSRAEHEMSLLNHFQILFASVYKKYVVWENIFWGIFNIFANILVLGMIWYLIENWSENNIRWALFLSVFWFCGICGECSQS